MNNFLRMVASAALSLVLVAGIGVSLTGCSADTLSGPDLETYADDKGGGTSGAGSEHNTDKTDNGGGGTSGAGSEHNTD